MQVGDKCPKCLRLITAKVLAEKYNRKVENARRSTAKRIASGKKSGRPKLRDDEEIKRLRKTGLSMREIAQRIGMSTTAVQRALK